MRAAMEPLEMDDARLLLWPRRAYREACPKEVPPEIAEDYDEACLVIDDSPTAAGALGRRCMELVLEQAGGAKGRTLADKIDDVIAKEKAPAWVIYDLHTVRKLGNFAAHASEDVTGRIIRVDSEEAQWTLNVLQTLFDFYYVMPAKSKERAMGLAEKQKSKTSVS